MRRSTIYLSRVTGPATRTYGEGTDSALTITLPMQARDCERETCAQCGAQHDALWAIARVPVAPFGHFTVYRVNGSEHVPDMSVPMAVDRIPRDARRLTPAEAAARWHDSSGSHVF
jgi:hypothetical protein